MHAFAEDVLHHAYGTILACLTPARLCKVTEMPVSGGCVPESLITLVMLVMSRAVKETMNCLIWLKIEQRCIQSYCVAAAELYRSCKPPIPIYY